MLVDRSMDCRCCGSTDLLLVHDFGPQPLAGRYPRTREEGERTKKYPLDLTQCLGCGLLQVTHLPPISEIFNEEYCYSSSTIPDLRAHFRGYAQRLAELIPAGSSVFEFGCNDGVLLELLQSNGYQCAGVDASDNVATLARSKGLKVGTGFLTTAYVRENGLAGRFQLVTCSNVFAHIHDLRSTMSAVRLLLAAGGLFCIEVHDGDRLIEDVQFDTVYHEHLSYFTEASLRRFLELEGLAFVACERTPMHGGGLRMIARMDASAPAYSAQASIAPLGNIIEEKIKRCRADIEELHAEFGPLDGYGAAGRSQMFINMTGASSCFRQVFDDSPLRQGRYIAGTAIPVVPYHTGMQGACCVVLAWNYAPTISARIKRDYRSVVTVLPSLQQWQPG